MKIRVTFTIELDETAWAQYQGLNEGETVREDVKSHCLNTLQCNAFLEEADAKVRLA